MFSSLKIIQNIHRKFKTEKRKEKLLKLHKSSPHLTTTNILMYFLPFFPYSVVVYSIDMHMYSCESIILLL